MLEVRRMRPGDIHQIHEIHTQAVRQVCSKFLSGDTVEAWLYGRTPEGYLTAEKEHGEMFWVAQDTSADLAGYASWHKDHLISLFVRPSLQRRGIGQALFDACEAEALRDGFEFRRIKSTLNAQSFYERLGFAKVKDGFEVKRGERIPHVEMAR